MNVAAELLRDYLAENDISQGQFADACEVDQALISQILAGKILISQRNLNKLLRGIKDPATQKLFVVTHLRDQVPTEHVHDIMIRVAGGTDREEMHVEPAKVFDRAIAEVLAQLPTQTKATVYHFLQALRLDPTLREVFRGLMRYVPVPHAPRRVEQEERVGTAGPFPVLRMKAEQQKRDADKSNRAPNKLPRSAQAQSKSVRLLKTK